MLTAPKRLGDPHLGRRFTKGVPPERRGQREQLVRADFVRQLDPAGAPTHICMGDLFDKPQVPYEDLAFAAMAYTDAALANPGTTFYVIQGNHDDSRDLDEVTAWDIFCRLMALLPNVVCVTRPMAVPGVGLLLPWDPTQTAVELLAVAADKAGYLGNVGIETAYGHWDVDPRTAGHNIIPTKELAALGITQAYTGHVHKPESFVRDGVDVTVVGSMQPYAQGEDGGQSLGVRYFTYTLAEFQRQSDLGLETNPFDDACIRLLLAPGEQYDGDIPLCLSWDVQRLRPVDAETPADVSMDGFDTAAVARAALDEHEIIPEVREKIDQRWQETFGGEG